MFRNLSYSVTFPQTGRRLEAKLDFASGFSAITGPNESGKSMIFEMLRFLLFGTQALRGEADQYANLKAECEVVIKSEEYRIVRTMKKADIWRGAQLIATGVTAVNDKVGKILGFGRAVFDVACSINQGEVERLGSMTSAERKKLVDSVLGIDALDVVAKWGMEEAKLLERDAANLRQRLVFPTVPVEPDEYTPTAELREKLELLQTQSTELSELNGWLSATRTKPVKPTCSVDLPATALVQFAEQRRALREQVHSLEARIAALPTTAPYTEAELDAMLKAHSGHSAAMAAKRALEAIRVPSYGIGTLQGFAAAHESLSATTLRRAKAQRIEELKQTGSAPCPHCGEEILAEHAQISELEAALGPELPEVDTPPISLAKVEAELRAWETFDQAEYDRHAAVPWVDAPAVALHEIDSYRARIGQVEERARLCDEVNPDRARFAAMPDYEKMLADRRAFEEAHTHYMVDAMAFESWQADYNIKKVRREVLAGVPNHLMLVQLQHVASSQHEQAVRAWEVAVEAYRIGGEVADNLEAKAAEHRKVRDVMNVLRSLIKQHVLPSLNKVASHLLVGMTGGQRNVIIVDEEFNVLVDNQDIQTLSGSGKSVANLALRIALGQVLTNRVISVLLADEIDAAMDEFRAENTALVLRTLENSISQVLLISHKSIEADNSVRLGEISGQTPSHTRGT
jgi:exonuclease SbcC